MWQIVYHPLATAGIYKIPRGTAGLVTDAIRNLARNPKAGEPIPGRANTYRLQVAGHVIEYELKEETSPKQIVILNIV